VPLNDTEIRYYDSNVLRLPNHKRKEYHGQVDRLVSDLSKRLRDQSELKVTKVVKAGSFAKYTILRKTSEDPVDVDVVFYISGRSVEKETLASLKELIYEALIKLYPTKAIEDFEIQRKAATVTFVGSGLSVDIVPVIEDVTRPGYGWQFDIHDSTKVQTCAPCQIKFVRDRKDMDEDFRTLVRLAKKWRNRIELKPLKSFAVELIMAHVLARNGAQGSIEQRFRDFLLYIAQSELKEVITFPENGKALRVFADPVVILDPVCDVNNVAARISEDERQEIVKAAKDAWETANFASTEDNIEVWKELFGPRFKIREEG
jgi:Second Messenger Oligonucleotide or Dinucleotide Synthetase domain/tRNA nucleotidyltransferase, second domain